MIYSNVLFIFIHINYGMLQNILINKNKILTNYYSLFLLWNIYTWDFKIFSLYLFKYFLIDLTLYFNFLFDFQKIYIMLYIILMIYIYIYKRKKTVYMQITKLIKIFIYLEQKILTTIERVWC